MSKIIMSTLLIFILITPGYAGRDDCPDQFTVNVGVENCPFGRVYFYPDITCSPSDTKYCHSNYYLRHSDNNYENLCLSVATYIRQGDHYKWGGSPTTFTIYDENDKKVCP